MYRRKGTASCEDVYVGNLVAFTTVREFGIANHSRVEIFWHSSSASLDARTAGTHAGKLIHFLRAVPSPASNDFETGPAFDRCFRL